ncbi:hypothetical protein [Bartonella sp. AC134YNZD]|uniref:hypothetical protein n=1 Tax=Bartonella sp. AC134YNZD TaxID=3243446 RepID=UPI0035CFE8B6
MEDDWKNFCEDDQAPKGRKKKNKKKSSQQTMKERYEARDPEVGLLGEPSGKFDYYVKYSQKKEVANPVQAPQWSKPNKGVPIAYYHEGNPVYKFSKNGHCFWDACDCDDCHWDAIYEDDRTPKGKKKKKSENQILKERYEAGDPEVGLLGEPSGKFDYYVLYPRRENPTELLEEPSQQEATCNVVGVEEIIEFEDEALALSSETPDEQNSQADTRGQESIVPSRVKGQTTLLDTVNEVGKAQSHMTVVKARPQKVAFIGAGPNKVKDETPVTSHHIAKSDKTVQKEFSTRIKRRYQVYTNRAYKLRAENGLRIGPINGKFLKQYYP